MVGNQKAVSDEEFVRIFKEHGSPSKVASIIGVDVRNVYHRRQSIEKRLGIKLTSFNAKQKSIANAVIPDNRRVMTMEIENGMVFIASDAHYWPDEVTTAHLAFVKLLKKYKPETVIMNGDVFDGARISRHEPLYGTNPPTVKQEIEACTDRLFEVADASKNAKKIWTLGNHDIRIFRTLAVNSPELLESMDLFSYFPGWNVVWRVDVNNDVVIKHRWHNGQHATFNNTVKSGKTLVTGHLHKLQCTPWSDFHGRRWGVDTGTLAEPYGEQFVYCEGNPVNWCSGFAVLTFKDGKLLPPELCEVLDGVAYFRGEAV